MANILPILILAGVALALITIVSVTISCINRLNTDESLYEIFLFTKINFIYFSSCYSV